MANQINLSPHTNIEHAKKVLEESRSMFLGANFNRENYLPERAHAHFVRIKYMQPNELKDTLMVIRYDFAQSPFGETLVAYTNKGICHVAFVDDRKKAVENLKRLFPGVACHYQVGNDTAQRAMAFFTHNNTALGEIKLHVKATDFQLMVWEALLKIPVGSLLSYSDVAILLNRPAISRLASRAVGSAVGSNPIAFFIPCHRVIRSTGILGEYRWGSHRKKAIIGWETMQE